MSFSYNSHYGGSALASTSGPITRSRTGLFLSYRDTVIRSPSSRLGSKSISSRKGKGRAYDDSYDDEERSGLLANGADANGNGDLHQAIEMDNLPPQWIDEADKVDDILDRLKPRLTQLDKMHAKHILPGFADKSAEERDIASATADITRELRRCQNIIAKIAQMAKRMPMSTSKEDRIMIGNVQSGLATKVQNVSTIFRKKQTNYLRQLRGYETKSHDKQASSGASSPRDAYASVNDDIQLSQDTLATTGLSLQVQSQAQQTVTGMSMEAITQRDREVSSIAESITDLATLFKDLSSLVIDQGTLLDRIDYNIEQMATDMEGAVKELQTATTYQKRSGKRQLICLLVLLIVGAAIVLVFKPRRTGPGDIPVSPPPIQQPNTGDNAQPGANAAAAAWKLFPSDFAAAPSPTKRWS
ncbi:t-SNARE affecting a late Golgi compartment protein 2 [Cystobasidiomycetes sp. EMM_F5]